MQVLLLLLYHQKVEVQVSRSSTQITESCIEPVVRSCPSLYVAIHKLEARMQKDKKERGRDRQPGGWFSPEGEPSKVRILGSLFGVCCVLPYLLETKEIYKL